MKANEFIKKYGVDEAKYFVDKVIDHISMGDDFKAEELKRLIESHDLVKSYNGIYGAKNTLKLFLSSIEIGLYHGIDGVNSEFEIPRLKQAIADVESYL